MSRTDVHAPAWVKQRDPLWRSHFTESHNHAWHAVGHEKVIAEDGSATWKTLWKRVEHCDIDEYLAARGTIRTACQIYPIATRANIDCGCSMCTGQFWRRLTNRAERHTIKKLLRAGRFDEVGGSHRRWRY